MQTDQPSNPQQLEGYRAYQAHQTMAANPYPFSTDRDKCIAWNRGHAWARTDRARALRRTTTEDGATA